MAQSKIVSTPSAPVQPSTSQAGTTSPKLLVESKKVYFVEFTKPWQILPGITISELRHTDKLGRYLAMGRNMIDAPEMTFYPQDREIEIAGYRFPLGSGIFRYSLVEPKQ